MAELKDEILGLMHHFHHDFNMNHSVHHCGGKHQILDYSVDIEIQHCKCRKHRCNKQKSFYHLGYFIPTYTAILLTEKCPEGGWHLESAEICSTIDFPEVLSPAVRTAFLHGLHNSTKWLLNHGLLKSPLLDFGCGYGVEAQILQEEYGFEVCRYDPYFFPSLSYYNKFFKTVLCSYVLQAIPQKEEREWIVKNCISRGEVCYFVIRRDKLRIPVRYSYEHLELPLYILHEEPNEYIIYSTEEKNEDRKETL